MRRGVAVLVTMAAMLTVPAAAFAGGWATVGLSSVPDGIPPGQPWKVDVTILAHGVTPAEGLTPELVITGGDGTTRSFPARAVGAPGVYRANVVFPSKGNWSYSLGNGFMAADQTLGKVQIGGGGGEVAAAPTASGGGQGGIDLPLALLAALLAGGVSVLGVVLIQRRSAFHPTAT
jgi:hypothetical protein